MGLKKRTLKHGGEAGFVSDADARRFVRFVRAAGPRGRTMQELVEERLGVRYNVNALIASAAALGVIVDAIPQRLENGPVTRLRLVARDGGGEVE